MDRWEARLLAAIAAVGLVLSPAFAAGTSTAKKRPPAVSLSFDPISSFTPANGDPRLAAALRRQRPLALTDFKFTPAAAKGRPSQIRVAIRARAAGPAQRPVARARKRPASAVDALAPSTYNLGVAVGWRRFAVAGDVAKVKNADPALGGRETRGRRRQLFVEALYRPGRGRRRPQRRPRRLPALRKGDNYSLDVGGSYSLSRRIALTGGVRYKIERDSVSALQDDRRDSQAVYVGTAFKF